jgi:LysM repeat protein
MTRRRRSPARWLAPIALLAVTVAVYSVVNASLLSNDDSARTGTAAGQTSGAATTADGKATKAKRKRRRAYRVKPGDTLSSIAVKTGVPLERIQQLNPKLDSNALQTGQRVKLSP